jgi:hypothetical protein
MRSGPVESRANVRSLRRNELSTRNLKVCSVAGLGVHTCAYRKLDAHILVMQSTQNRAGEYATHDLDRARNWRILVQGDDAVRMVAEKCPAALRRWSPPPRHVLDHARLSDDDAKFE